MIVSVPRVSLAELIAKVADALERKGTIDGDLKAGNVILAGDGRTVLIDAFDLTEGVRSPGWSPNWSAAGTGAWVAGHSGHAAFTRWGLCWSNSSTGTWSAKVRNSEHCPDPDGRDEFSVVLQSLHISRAVDVEWSDAA